MSKVTESIERFEHLNHGHDGHLEEAYKELRRLHSGDNSDEVAVNALDPDQKIRKAIAAKLANGGAAKTE